MLKVEKCIEQDRSRICDLARVAHEESLFSDIAFSADKLYRSFDNTLEEPQTYLGLKVALNEKILGFCYALCGGYYIGDGANVVTVISFVIDPDVRGTVYGGKAALRLAKGIEVWGRDRGASYILYHATSGTTPANTDRFFRKLGASTLGGNYGLKL